MKIVMLQQQTSQFPLQGCGSELEVFEWSLSLAPNKTRSWSWIFFVRIRLRKSNWIIFYITLLSWEMLLKWYNFLRYIC